MNRRGQFFMLLLAVVAAACSGAFPDPLTPKSAQARHYDDADFFYHDLSPHGQWIVTHEYGRCWRPYYVPAGWRPYSEGHWEYTSYGWTWVPDEPWGAIPFHYGRWFFDPVYGWLWVPGREWGPAWVLWRRGGGFIGWAPLPPGWGPAGVVEQRVIIEPAHYCFVEERKFAEPRVTHFVVTPSRNAKLVNETRNVTNYAVINDRVVNRSVKVEEIEKVSGHPIRRREIMEVKRAAPKEDFRPKVREEVPKGASERGLESKPPVVEREPGDGAKEKPSRVERAPIPIEVEKLSPPREARKPQPREIKKETRPIEPERSREMAPARPPERASTQPHGRPGPDARPKKSPAGPSTPDGEPGQRRGTNDGLLQKLP